MYNSFEDLNLNLNLSLIDDSFKNYIVYIGNNLEGDLLQRATLLEDFLIGYFDLQLKNYATESCEQIIALKKFVEKLDKSYLKGDYLYKKNLDLESVTTENLVERFLEYKTFSYFQFTDKTELYKISHGVSHRVSLNLNIGRHYGTGAWPACFSQSDCIVRVDLDIYYDSFRSYLLNILYEENYSEYLQSNPIFNLPRKIEYDNLVDNRIIQPRVNDFNFHWIYEKGTENHAKIQANYCLKCHERKKDSCRAGLKNKDQTFQKNPLDNLLHGCPLEQHISESIKLFETGKTLAALAVIMINNPLVVLTGYRICNDCVKSCIFQKQSAVDIPSIETTILDSILSLKFGIEIYLLLTQWNPLRKAHILPAKKNGKKVLVVGLGPAGISASYHLLMVGFQVVALEATKIEPIEEKFLNVSIEKLVDNNLDNNLENRVISGFGGVMEYGITHRWNKNYLQIPQIMLERNKNFNYYDGIRFDSNYFIKDAFEIDKFDHIVIATGSSNQRIPEVFKCELTSEIRLATDFLMTLQLGGAYKFDHENLATVLQVQLPAIVLGGGLTAIDTATEILNYYPRQLLKMRRDVSEIGLENVVKELNILEKKILEEFLLQAEFIKNCTSQLEIYNYLESLGGVRVVYHKAIQKSNAYTTNHEELREAMKMGVKFVENFELKKILRSEEDSIIGIEGEDGRILKAKNIFIACGSNSNHQFLKKLGISEDKIIQFFYTLSGKNIKEKSSTLIDKRISLAGDINPQFGGSVVKAILSGRVVSEELERLYQETSEP